MECKGIFFSQNYSDVMCSIGCVCLIVELHKSICINQLFIIINLFDGYIGCRDFLTCKEKPVKKTYKINL